MNYDVSIDGKSHRLELQRDGQRWLGRLDGREIQIDAVLVQRNVLSMHMGEKNYEIRCEPDTAGAGIWVGSTRFAAVIRDPRSLRGRERARDDRGPIQLTAPMPGKIVRVLLSHGAAVETGDGVVVVEAMKMQNEIKSPKHGILQKVLVSEGDAVNAGDVLAIVE